MSFVVPGHLPKRWSITRLGALVEERNQRVSDRNYQPLSVTMDGVVPQLDHVAKTTHSDKRKLVRTGDLVINSRSDRKGASGLAEMDGSVSQISIVMKLRRGHSGYLHHMLRSIPFQEEFYRRGKGIHDDLWSTRYDELKRIEVPFPPQTIQKEIANFLDRETSCIDKLMDRKKRLIELMEEKRTALITRAVTKGLDPDVVMKDSGIEWLGEIPEDWDVTRLRRVANVIDCKHRTPEYIPDGFPLVSTSEVKPGTLDLSVCTRFVGREDYEDMTEGLRQPRIGDIIYSRNASLGQGALVETEESFCMGQDVVLIRTDGVLPKFLNFQLNSPVATRQVEAVGVGSTFSRINVSTIRDLLIIDAPHEDQERIARELNRETVQMEQLQERAASAIDLLEEYRSALIAAAVTGKIDVRDHPSAA